MSTPLIGRQASAAQKARSAKKATSSKSELDVCTSNTELQKISLFTFMDIRLVGHVGENIVKKYLVEFPKSDQTKTKTVMRTAGIFQYLQK